MKNIKFIFAALMSVAALSCQKELPLQTTPEIDSEANKIPLVLKTGKETKTSLQSDGSIHWTLGDKLAVFDNSATGDNNNRFTATNVNGTSAEFSGSVGITTSYIAVVYPYELAISGELTNSLNPVGQLVRKYKLKVRVPHQQTAKAGTFADAHNISVSKASVTQGEVDEATISFKNVCALLKFTLPENLPANIEKVTIFSNTAIAGEMNVDYKGDTPSCSMSNNQLSEITMTGNFVAGQTYYFVLAPVTLDGISIAVEDENGNVYRKSSLAQIQLSQGKYRNLGKLEFDKMGEIAVSAEHVFEESILSGTKLSVALPHSDITKINLTVTNKDNNAIVRSIANLNDVADGVAISNYNAADNCPYLPYGEYSLTGTYTTKSLGQITVEESFSITERPVDLNVTSVGAFTSYTEYLEKDIAKANELEGSYIYLHQIGGISAGILNKTHYASYITASFDSGNAISAISKKAGEYQFKMPNYRKYSTVKLTFDGVPTTEFALTDCYVTGIPYVLNPATNDGWVTTGKSHVEWNEDGAVILGYNLKDWSAATKSEITKTFCVPDQIDVVLNSTGSVEGSLTQSTQFTIHVSGVEKYNVTASKRNSANITVNNIGCSLTSSTPTVKCANSNSTSTACSKIETLSIQYNTL